MAGQKPLDVLEGDRVHPCYMKDILNYHLERRWGCNKKGRHLFITNSEGNLASSREKAAIGACSSGPAGEEIWIFPHSTPTACGKYYVNIAHETNQPLHLTKAEYDHLERFAEAQFGANQNATELRITHEPIEVSKAGALTWRDWRDRLVVQFVEPDTIMTFRIESEWEYRTSDWSNIYRFFHAALELGKGWNQVRIVTQVPLPMLYSGFHFLALSMMFPTPVERTLWRLACALTAAYVPTYICLACLISFLNDDSRQKWTWSHKPSLMILYALTIVPLFILPRAYIIIECFISLRAVPIGVYQMPGWLDMIPHF